MKKKIALLLATIMVFVTAVPTFALNKTMVDSMVEKISAYDSDTRQLLFANIAVFSGDEKNIEMGCGQIDARSGMIYDMIKPLVDELGAEPVKAMLRSIVSLGCRNMKGVFNVIADAKEQPQPILLSSTAKSGMTTLLNVLDTKSPELAAIFREDGVNESVLGYILKNMFLNVGNGDLFKYDKETSVFSVRAISSTFENKFNSVWQGIELAGERITADTLVDSMLSAFNSLTAQDALKVAKALDELGLCEVKGDGQGNAEGGGTTSGGGAIVDKEDDKETTPANPNGKEQFTDLGNYAWAKDAIYELRDKGIINGTTQTTFSPANNIKRGDFILILTRMLGISGGTGNFDDVPQGSYYYDAICAAKASGIAKGTDGNFMPEASITRQDLITLAYRAFYEKGYISATENLAVLDTFSDSSLITDYAKEAMAAMVNEGIIKGSDGGVNPIGYATRAEVAMMCSRLLKLIK